MRNELKEYYQKQSSVTSPGLYYHLFDDLPNDLPSLCQIVKGLIRHYADDESLFYPKHLAFFHEMNLRYVEHMLERITHYNHQPLATSRKISERIMGICRDNSVLVCAILRHKNIPARLRSGFVNYLIPGLYLDGVAVEYWDEIKNKWCYVDTRTSREHMKKLGLFFDLYDLPADRFMPAADAWRLCRNKKIPENQFGFTKYRGLSQVRNRLIQDLAFLNKEETLLWDIWGLMREGDDPNLVSESQFLLLDNLSYFLSRNSYDLSAIRSYYKENAVFRIPESIDVYNPFCAHEKHTFSLSA